MAERWMDHIPKVKLKSGTHKFPSFFFIIGFEDDAQKNFAPNFPSNVGRNGQNFIFEYKWLMILA